MNFIYKIFFARNLRAGIHLSLAGLLASLAWSQARAAQNALEEVDFVNPFIGTSSHGFGPGLDGGGLIPSVGVPFAMTEFVAQTDENKMSRMPYNYESSSLCGFLASHQPTVWMGDYGYVSVMPEIGELKPKPKDRALSFSHKDESSTPYYYSVVMSAGEGKTIKAEIAAASRCGCFRFTFPESDKAHLVVQGINLNPELGDWANDYGPRLKALKGYAKIDKDKGEITGYNPDRQSAQLGPDLPNFKGYFVIQFDKAIESFGTWSGDEIHPGSVEQFGTRMGAYISFKTKAKEIINVKIATSFISLDQARENLKREAPDWDFEKLVKSTRAEWQKNLSRVKVEGVSEDQKTIFYTAMYHCLLFPREFSEYGKYYSAFDDRIHEGVSYNDYSLWDTFRALHPLLMFIQPERVNPMITSLLQMYKEGGWLPKWPNPTYTSIMIATPADSVIADAYVKGFRGYDLDLAYEAIRKDAFVPPDCDTTHRWADRDRWSAYEARGGLSYYHSLGYVPVDKVPEAVSSTIEFSYDDYCVAQMARGLGKTEDYERLMANSRNYRNLYNKSTGFMASRKFNGEWDNDVNKGFTEGDKWTYLFGAMHDVPGMIELMGGNTTFEAKLDENFTGNHYRHDNEPGHHYVYLYDYCGRPWKTQELVRKHTTLNYRNEPNGVNGNDDCGQMSAWYLFSIMGFYPVTPGTDRFAIGAPQFPKVTLQLENNGKQQSLEIIAHNLSEKNLYVQSLSLDGRPFDGLFLSYSNIVSSHQLIFEMGAAPESQKTK